MEVLGALTREQKYDRGFDTRYESWLRERDGIMSRTLDSEAAPGHLPCTATIDHGIVDYLLVRQACDELLYVIPDRSS